MTILEKKYKIFQTVEQFQDEKAIDYVLSILEDYRQNLDSVAHLIQATRKNLDVEQLAQQQQYKGIELNAFLQRIKNLNVEESTQSLIDSVEK
jgi:ABC-type Na+ efflux pump permease subunit